MPIYEFYCPDNHRIYSFFARTAAERDRIPKCPDHPEYRMVKIVSSFAIGGATRKSRQGDDPPPADPGGAGDPAPGGDEAEDPRMLAAMSEMERAMDGMDEENPDPRQIGRLMRRMAELSGERIDGQMEEMVRKLEEGHDPERLEEELSGFMDEDSPGAQGAGGFGAPPSRDPSIHDYD